MRSSRCAPSPRKRSWTRSIGATTSLARPASALSARSSSSRSACGDLGRIFEDFRSGALDADDEVALVFDPQTLQPLSEPLVNVRVALAEAVAAGIVAQEEAAALLDAARVLPYPHRTYPRIADGRDALLRFLTEFATDQKAEDARTALRLAARRGVAIPADDRDLPVRPGPPRPGPRCAARARPQAGQLGQRPNGAGRGDGAARLGRVRALAGITRVGDVTGMDRLGVPSYIAVRPSRDRECNSGVQRQGAPRSRRARRGADGGAGDGLQSRRPRAPGHGALLRSRRACGASGSADTALRRARRSHRRAARMGHGVGHRQRRGCARPCRRRFLPAGSNGGSTGRSVPTASHRATRGSRRSRTGWPR